MAQLDNQPPEVCGVCNQLVHGPRPYHSIKAGGPAEAVHEQCWQVHLANQLNAAEPILKREEASNAN